MSSKYNYEQRETDLLVVQTGTDIAVKTYILMSPNIYGIGEGEFNKLTIQVPNLIRLAVREGYAWVIGDGKGIWNHVHVRDLAQLYEVFTARLLEGVTIPHGDEGIFFTENGEYSWLEVAEGIARVGFELGKLKTSQVRSLSISEATKKLWLQNKGWIGKTGMKTKARFGFNDSWVNVTPTTPVAPC
jgi:nucleoside-diphosphate-sugar epimerase